jgi:hypothetical protein
LDAASARHVAKEAVMAKQFATQQDRPAPEQAQPHAPVVRRAEAAPLVVGHAADAAERDADRVADEVIARLQGADAHVHAAGCGHDAPLARSFGPSTAPEVGYEGGELSDGLSGRIEGARGGGRPLDEPVRRRMEGAFGHSLAGVRIHTGGEAADLNRSISARAFTTGNDVFFGAGQYQPDTAEGERMLAHELAHTQQQGGAARRIHRWDFFRKGPMGIKNGTKRVKVLKSRAVFFLEHNDGSEMVVKPENMPVGLAVLAQEMHMEMGAARSVHHVQVGDDERTDVIDLVRGGQKTDNPSFAAFGAGASYKVPGVDKATAEPDEWGRQAAAFQLSDVGYYPRLVAMTTAQGKTAEDASKTDNKHSLMRSVMDNPRHMRQLGQVHAMDLFLGNSDRIAAGNFGNWFYEPNGAITLIDHVDQGQHMEKLFTEGGGKKWNAAADQEGYGGGIGQGLRKSALEATARETVETLVDRIGRLDKDFGEFMKQKTPSGEDRLTMMTENFAAGMTEMRKKLVKTFTATRFTLFGGKDRALKKEMKKAAKQAQDLDTGHSSFGTSPQADYYETLKKRAAWLAKN